MEKIKIFPSFISDKRTAKEAVKYFGYNIYNCSEELKNNKEIIKEAIKKTPSSIAFVSKELAEDPEIQSMLGKEKERLRSFYLSGLDKTIDFSKDLSSNDLVLMTPEYTEDIDFDDELMLAGYDLTR